MVASFVSNKAIIIAAFRTTSIRTPLGILVLLSRAVRFGSQCDHIGTPLEGTGLYFCKLGCTIIKLKTQCLERGIRFEEDTKLE